ncbi:hypothetical protein [Terrisporobacter sp.]|uniref:hypothetical protein n=1 Tax=Terrisporobacter sp. TaxID=1965305 RepID=UPI002ED086F9
MFAKFESFMNRVFMPLAHKVDNQRHLGAIKAGMVAMTPFNNIRKYICNTSSTSKYAWRRKSNKSIYIK